jgi:glycosyltransferase involved in cell wall biosynthesis
MLSIIIPAYNEEGSIAGVIDSINAVMRKRRDKYEIIVVDDASMDKTPQIAKKKAKVIEHPFNKGYGSSLKNGIRHAAGEWILIIDGDGTYPAEDIPKLMSHMDQYDMIVGSRTGKSVKVQSYRKPAKWFLTKLANYLSGSKIDDLNSGMRLFRKDVAMKFFNILPSGFSFTTTITLSYLSSDYNVKYVPINYHDRKGKSKIKPLRDGANFILLIIKAITYFNPLKIFLPIATVLFLIGFSAFMYQTFFLRNIEDFTMAFILTSIQIGFLGLLADMISKKEV